MQPKATSATAAQVLAGDATWCVIEGDCAPIVSDLTVDHVVSDPPYDQTTSEHARTLRGAIKNKRAVADEGHGQSRYIPFDGIDPSVVAPMLVDAARRWTIAFCALEQLGAYKAACPAQWVRGGFWHRLGGAPQFTGDRPAQPGEGIAILHARGRKRWNRGGHAAFYECARVATGAQPQAAERVHPTQKPIELMLAILADFTDAGDVVLDPFCGSGTTGVACLRLGRRFIGIERDSSYAAAARERLAAEAAGSTLRALRAGQQALFADAIQ